MRVMWGAMICVLLAALDQTVVIPALPSIAHELGAYKQLPWIVAAYLITSTISTPIYAKLSDIFGRRRLLTICIVLFVLTSILCAMAQSLDQLIWFRALQGLGGGGLMALTQAAIADVVSPRERGRYQGYISAVWATASVAGPLVGGFMAECLSWRWIFWLNLPVGVAAAWACHNGLRRLTRPRRTGRFRLDIPGAILVAGALSVLLLALGEGGTTYPWGSFQILSLIAGGLLLLALLVLQEMRAADPLLPPRVFASSSYMAAIVVSTMVSLLMFMCLFTIPLYFQLVRGATATQAGSYLAPFMFSSAAGNVVCSRWGRHLGTMRPVIRLASGVCFLGLALLALLPSQAPAWAVVLTLMLAGPGVGGCMIGSMMSAQNALPSTDIGSGTGALLVLRAVGGAAGTSLAGAIIAPALAAAHQTGTSALANLGDSFSTVYWVAAACAVVTLLVGLRMPNTMLRGTLNTTPLSE